MTVDESNQVQADFWAAAGSMWTAMRARFDAQVSEHGLAAIDALAPAPGESIIDVGCGAGTTTVQLAQRVGADGHVTGLDISPAMIEGATAHAAEQGVGNVEFVVGDAMVEPFSPDADGVYSRFGVMFFSDATAGFANLRTALRPGGRLGFVCWQSPLHNPWASRPLMIASDYVDIPFGGDPTAPGPFSLGDPDRLRRVLTDAGFDDVQLEPLEAEAVMGTDLADAVDFMFKLMPPIAVLEADDPDRADELRSRLHRELADWEGPDGVKAPSAVWIVTGRQPG